MGALTAIGAGLTVGAVALAGPAGESPRATSPPQLSDARLAAGVLFGCADSRAQHTQVQMARQGVAGIVLLGDAPPPDLRGRLRRVRQAAPAGIVIASDEEGGAVQRLAPLLGRLPGAETIGSWPRPRIERTAHRYAARMRRLGVDMSLAPVADLKVPGAYMAGLHRAFAANPKEVGRDAIAWSRGTEGAGVTPVVKHWPGHGHARDTHTHAARIPRLAALTRRDMVPFRMALRAGVPAVMVGHLQARGLTRRGVPASQSRPAISLLRQQAGPDAVIMTDSLSMAAASSARGLSHAQAVVAALRAGVDWAMVCSPHTPGIVRAVARAIRSGALSREALQRSAERIRAVTG